MPRRLAPLAVALAFTASVTAQERRPMLGMVVDESGAPLAGATVTAALVPRGAPGGEPADLLTATTDARGRFRLDALPCTTYAIWAIGARDEGGTFVASETNWGTAGRLIALRTGSASAPRTLELAGSAAWSEHGPLRVRVAPAGVAIPDSVVEVAADGTAPLPPLPAGQAIFEVRNARDEVLHLTTTTPRSSTVRIVLPQPQPLPMRVVDAGGAPIAGAVIKQRLQGGWSQQGVLGLARPPVTVWRRLGETDGEGRLVATVVSAHDPLTYERYQNLMFVAEKPGRALSFSGFAQRPYVDGKEVQREGLTELAFTLREQKPVSGRLLLDAEHGLEGQRATVRFGVRIQSLEGNGWRNEEFVVDATSGPDGTFDLPQLPTAEEGVSVVLAGGPARERLVPAEHLRHAAHAPIALHRRKVAAAGGLEVRLDALRRVQLQLLDESGGPAGGSDLLLMSRERDDSGCDIWTPAATTDSAGRVTMLVEPGKWLLFVRNESGMAHRQLDVADHQQLDLQLTAMPTMRGKVVDKDGKPIAGAQLDCHSSTWHNGPGEDEALRAVAGAFNWAWIDRTVTGPDGTFACRFLDLPGMSYEARVRHGEQQSADFQVVTGEDPVTIVVQ